MGAPRDTLPSDYFARLYEADPDPWRFATSAYERDKYAATVAALPQVRYARCLDVGSSIGVLTRSLAGCCDVVLGLDPVADAVADARVRCGGLPNVRFEIARVPEGWPGGTWDLIVCSEVLYYLSRRDLRRVAAQIATGLAGGGDIVLVHWIGETDYPLTGDEAAEGFIASLSALRPCAVDLTRGFRADRYRLDVLRCA